MAVIFLFIDGVGLGSKIESNPFHHADYQGFYIAAGNQIFDGNAIEIFEENHLFKKVDATLGVKGLPQSGTGQTTLFSGENAAKKIGRHFGPYPHSGIRYLLEEQSLFIKAQNRGKKCHFINAYPDIFFRKAEKSNRWSCTTLMTKSANLTLNSEEDVKKGRALTAEITQEAWRNRLNINVPIIGPETAAERLINHIDNFDLVLYEYYLTDKAGHSQSKTNANQFINTYNSFLKHLIQQRPSGATIILCSDHGNIEDLSIKTHTFNPVPLVCIGSGAQHLHHSESIMDVTPGILEILQ